MEWHFVSDHGALLQVSAGPSDALLSASSCCHLVYRQLCTRFGDQVLVAQVVVALGSIHLFGRLLSSECSTSAGQCVSSASNCRNATQASSSTAGLGWSLLARVLYLYRALQLLQVSLLPVQLGLPVTQSLLPLADLAQSLRLKLLLPGLQLLLVICQLLSPCLQTIHLRFNSHSTSCTLLAPQLVPAQHTRYGISHLTS